MAIVQVYSKTGQYAHLSYIMYCEEHDRLSIEKNTCSCLKTVNTRPCAKS